MVLLDLSLFARIAWHVDCDRRRLPRTRMRCASFVTGSASRATIVHRMPSRRAMSCATCSICAMIEATGTPPSTELSSYCAASTARSLPWGIWRPAPTRWPAFRASKQCRASSRCRSRPEQVSHLLIGPTADTLIGLRDRALLSLLYGTGIRASECASLRCGQVDLVRLTITVNGKGGHERTIPLNPDLATLLHSYAQARGPSLPNAPFFRSRFARALCRGAIYERVRTWGQRSRVGIALSPHRMRHTFATHLVRKGVGLVTIRDLLGHRNITSTQIYLHVTAEDLKAAAAAHPIGALLRSVEHLLPGGPLPFQRPRPFPARRQ